jgi:signal transduction histidine kinase
MNTVGSNETPLSEQGIIDIKYQKNLNMPLILIGLAVFLCFTVYIFLRASYLQAALFLGLSLTASISLILSYRIRDLEKLTVLKLVGAFLTFGLLAVSLLTGLFSRDIYFAYPWIFFYPITIAIFVGGRPGMVGSALFCAATAIAIVYLEFPEWTAFYLHDFRLNSILTLVILMLVGAVSENARLRLRNHLLEARNMYRQAEERQRRTNQELKSEIEMRLESEKALAQSERRYRALFEESAISLWEEDWSAIKAYLNQLPPEAGDDLEAYLKGHPDQVRQMSLLLRVTAVNRATLKLYAAESMPHLVRNIRRVLPSDLETFMRRRIAGIHHRSQVEDQTTMQTLEGRGRHLLITSAVPAGYEHSWEKVFSSVYDITERVAVEEDRKRMDRQLHHTRQIQAVASLAGGIAHQFNNALAVIWGSLDLLELDPQGPQPKNRFIESLRASTERMRALTEQLLAYARGGKYQPGDIAINKLIRDLLATGKAVRKPGIAITTRFQEGLRLTGGDATQIRNVLEAVLANAVEAMPQGGEVVIATREQLITTESAGDVALRPGRYVLITVTDQGVGMDEETLRRIFEPFFSTKFVGRGLGMAAVDGIVRNHDGRIEVQSALGQGTQVTITLPGANPVQVVPDPGDGHNT